MVKYAFKCPTCSHHRLEEVMVDVTQYSPFAYAFVDLQSNMADLNYEQPTTDGGRVARYQCGRCGLVLTTPNGASITSSRELAVWLRLHGIVASADSPEEWQQAQQRK